MAVMQPNNTSSLNKHNWARRIEPALYDSMLFIPTLDETAETINQQLTVRRLGRISTQTLADTNDGETFNFDTITPTAITLAPVWMIAAAAYADSAPRRQGDEIKPAYASNVEDALAAGLDYYMLSLIPSGTTTPIVNAAYNIDAAGLRSALAALVTNTKRKIKPGDDINLLLDTGQVDDALSIPEITQAYQRGDGRSPLVSGRVSTGYGFSFAFTTLLTSDANGKHGAAYKGQAIQYGYNKRPSPEVQRYKKQTRLMADAEIAGNIIYNEMLQPIRTA